MILTLTMTRPMITDVVVQIICDLYIRVREFGYDCTFYCIYNSDVPLPVPITVPVHVTLPVPVTVPFTKPGNTKSDITHDCDL